MSGKKYGKMTLPPQKIFPVTPLGVVTPLDFHPLWKMSQAFHRGSNNSKWISLLDTSTYDLYTLCDRSNQNVAHRGCEF